VYSVANEHISGLAASDAQVPHLMTAGFLAFGACTVVFASELERRLSAGRRQPGLGPALMAGSGLAMVAAGVFRRDRISNYPMPGEPHEPQSWRNGVHDLAAVSSAGMGIAALLALAWRFSEDPQWRPYARPALAAATASGALSSWFVRDVTRPGNGIVQRASITIPLVFMARVALKMLRAHD
jgi:hypothetical protein